jgi:hypothetical protein
MPAKAQYSGPEVERMKITVEAFWDEEAKVWVASAVGDIGLVTEAPSIEALQRRLALLAPDFLELEADTPLEIELLTRSVQTVAAE